MSKKSTNLDFQVVLHIRLPGGRTAAIQVAVGSAETADLLSTILEGVDVAEVFNYIRPELDHIMETIDDALNHTEKSSGPSRDQGNQGSETQPEDRRNVRRHGKWLH